MSLLFNGGFLKPSELKNPTITSSRNSDVVKTFIISEDNTTYHSTIFPVLSSVDETANLTNPMILELFYDTTNKFMKTTGWVETPPDDFHPPIVTDLIEKGEDYGIFNNKYIKTATFLPKIDSTSNYIGKDRFDNFIHEVMPHFNKFKWTPEEGKFDLFTQKIYETFSGGDLYSSQNSLHLAFLHSKNGTDGTNYIADLYYTHYSENDGTFFDPVVLVSDIDIAGYGGPSEDDITLHIRRSINRKTNPRFLKVPNVGLFLNYMTSGFNRISDTTEFYMNMLLSRNDGTTWGSYNNFPLKFFTKEKTSAGIDFGINEINPPQFNWAFGENKIVCLNSFFDYRGSHTGSIPNVKLTRSNANLLISFDQGKTFSQTELNITQLTGLFNNLEELDPTFSEMEVRTGAIYYDPKISKFVIPFMISNFLPYSIFGTIINQDEKLNSWIIGIMRNTGLYPFIKGENPKSYNMNSADGILESVGPTFASCVDENDICWVAANVSMGFGVNNIENTYVNKFENFLDYTGTPPGIANSINNNIPNPLLIPIEMVPSTDSYLNQWQLANSPWRARKLDETKYQHTNGARENTEGVYSGTGSGLNPLLDGILFSYCEAKSEARVGSPDTFLPDPNFYIQSITSFKNNIWMLATTIRSKIPIEQRYFDYQIPTLIHRPSWSNINIKPRKNLYFVPTRFPDNTFFGWQATGALNDISIEKSAPHINSGKGKFWEAKFFRNDTSETRIFSCGLQQFCDSTFAFVGRRGINFDVDSTRGSFVHFCVSMDSKFQKSTNDITSMIFYMSIPTTRNTTAAKTSLSIFLGKGHVGFNTQSSTPVYQTNFVDQTKDMEFLCISNRFKNTDATDEYRVFFRYKGISDWTLFFYQTSRTGASDFADMGIKFGNLHRWPTVITGDLTNVVYFKWLHQGWSALGMQNMTTGGESNKTCVLPTMCARGPTYLPKGVVVNWTGQDGTMGAKFNVIQKEGKFSLDKMFNKRSSIGWESFDTTGITTINIDFGEVINLDTVILQDCNISDLRMFYGQENNTTDLTSFLYTNDAFMNTKFFPNFSNINVVGRNSLFIISNDETDILSSMESNQLVGQDFRFHDNNNSQTVTRRCIYSHKFSDLTTYLEFEETSPVIDGMNQANSRNMLDWDIDSVIISAKNKLFNLLKPIQARYIQIKTEGFGTADPNRQVNFENKLRIGNLFFGILQKNENPIQTGFSQTTKNIVTLQTPLVGPADVGTPGLSLNKFELKYEAAYLGRGNQFEQLDNLIKDSGVSRDSFFFIKSLSEVDTVANQTLFGTKFETDDFYFTRISSNPSIERNGNLASVTLSLDEVK